MWLHVLLVIRESSVAVWGCIYMSTFIGSMCWNEWCSSSCRWCITAFLGTWWTTAFQSPMWPSFCQASLPRCASTQSQLIWASGICCCQLNSLKLPAWNSLNDDLHDPMLSTDSFRRLLKTWFFSEYEYLQSISMKLCCPFHGLFLPVTGYHAEFDSS